VKYSPSGAAIRRARCKGRFGRPPQDLPQPPPHLAPHPDRPDTEQVALLDLGGTTRLTLEELKPGETLCSPNRARTVPIFSVGVGFYIGATTALEFAHRRNDAGVRLGAVPVVLDLSARGVGWTLGAEPVASPASTLVWAGIAGAAPAAATSAWRPDSLAAADGFPGIGSRGTFLRGRSAALRAQKTRSLPPTNGNPNAEPGCETSLDPRCTACCGLHPRDGA
jgi:hypothetical protein